MQQTDKQEINSMLLEDAMKELEAIATAMEQEDITMEQSIQLYERGLLLANHCRAKLDGFQKRIAIIENGEEQPLEE